MNREKRLLTGTALVLALVAGALGRNIAPPMQHDPVDLPEVQILRNVSYGQADGVNLDMTLYVPDTARVRPAPAVLCLHGGAWRAGAKMGLSSPLLPLLIRRGYVVASIDYRLAPEFKFPAQIEDAKCAVRFLRAQAKDLHIDPNRIGAVGESAGGHLAALLGLTGPGDGFDGDGGWESESSRVQAVADLFGPTDLTDWDIEGHPDYQRTAEAVFGADHDSDPILRRASPVTYISSNAPPFFILHGNLDNVVPVGQSVELYDKLKAAGDSATLLIVTNFGHGGSPPGLEPSPAPREFTEEIADFFDRTLKQ